MSGTNSIPNDELESSGEKLRSYHEQLGQVEAALADTPHHPDLLSIKSDLLEIIKILTSQLPCNLSSNDGTGPSISTAGEKDLKTETDHGCVSLEKQKGWSSPVATDPTLTARNNLVPIKVQGDGDFNVNTSQETTFTPEIDDYLNFDVNDKEIIDYIIAAKRKNVASDESKFVQEMKNFVAEKLPSKKDAHDNYIPITHRDFRDVTDRTLKNFLNKQKRRMKKLEVNGERAAKGLAPISLKAKNINVKKSIQ